MSIPGLARQGRGEQADEQFRIFILYQSICIYTYSAKRASGECATAVIRFSKERRRRANGARGRLSSNEGGRQPLRQLPAVIFRLRTCTKVLEGKNSSTYVYTML